MIAVKFLLLVVSVLIGYFLGYFFTETKYYLSKYDVFKFTLFECRQCLSFHIAWVTSTFISLLLGDWYMLIIGVFFAFMLFIGLRIDQKRKTIKIDYDENKEEINIINYDNNK